MKAVRIQRFGKSDMVRIEEMPIPRTKRGQALIRVHAAGVNPVDWMVREKIYNPQGADRVPLTLGQDFSGVIERIPAGSRTRLREGDEVFGEGWGSFAEYIVAPLKDLVKKPRAIDFVTAASIPMPGLTAWQMVIDTAKAKRGMRFLIHGASGAVGSFAAQLAKWKGAEVIATASRPSSGFLRRIGVDKVIDYNRERFEDLVHDVDVVIEHFGGDIQERSWSTLKKGGMLINLIGEIDRSAARKAGVRAVEFSMKYDTDDLKEIARLIERDRIKPHISKVLPLRQARRAMDLNQQNRSHGKFVLKAA
jgi:NADPH:quinone reductase-like Zn-dependent oxidoreductase